MQIITTNEIMANARIEESTETTIVAAIGDAAEQAVLNMIERDVDSLLREFGSIPTPIKQACLMMATHLYENRGIVTPGTLNAVPYGFDALLKPYIRY